MLSIPGRMLAVLWVNMMVCGKAGSERVMDFMHVPSTNCSQTCSVDERVKCKVSSPGNLLGSSEQLSSDVYPGPPSSLQVRDTASKNGNVQINIKWMLPKDASYKKLLGFHLKIVSTSSTATSSAEDVFFNVSQSDLLSVGFQSALSMEFSYNCLQLSSDTETIVIFLYSLPLPRVGNLLENFQMKFHKISPHHRKGTASNSWVSSITNISIISSNYSSQPCEHSVNVSFSVSANVSLSFNVLLCSTSDVNTCIPPECKKDSSRFDFNPKISFTSLCSGQYKIQIWPLKKALNNQCVCGVADSTLKTCKQCARLPFSIKLNSEGRNNTREQSISRGLKNNTREKSISRYSFLKLIFGILTIVVLTVGIIIGLILVLYYKKYTSRDNENPESSGSVSVSEDFSDFSGNVQLLIHRPTPTTQIKDSVSCATFDPEAPGKARNYLYNLRGEEF